MNDSEGIKAISISSGFEQEESQVKAIAGPDVALFILMAMAFYVVVKHS